MMGAENKAANKITEIKGKIRKKAGQERDNRDPGRIPRRQRRTVDGPVQPLHHHSD